MLRDNHQCLLVALMCRLIQLLILIYGIFYLMIHKKGYQETDTSIISSITLKVKVNRFFDKITTTIDVNINSGYLATIKTGTESDFSHRWSR